MRQKLVELPVGVRVTALAAGQHGVVTRAQLNALGLSDAGIRRRIHAGWLHRVHRGVYAVGAPALGRHGHFLAAVLALGDGAVLSHRSAAALWDLLPSSGPRIDVTVATQGGRSARRIVVVHRSPLGEDEISRKDCIPVTSPARTIADLAAVAGAREVERAPTRLPTCAWSCRACDRGRAARAAAGWPACSPSTPQGAPARSASSRSTCSASAAAIAFPSPS